MDIDFSTIRAALKVKLAARFLAPAVALPLAIVSAAGAAEPANNPAPKYVPPAKVKPIAGRQESASSAKKAANVQVGSASWYGKAFQGKPTASGESYDMWQYNAAHRSLPLGTWVRVTNLKNGKSLIVRVNDRGPFVDTGKRIVDVSYAAARMLEFSGQGLARVKLEVVEPETVAYAAQGAGLE
jgi:rare lipoprotein A